jgi:hypothetical protein
MLKYDIVRQEMEHTISYTICTYDWSYALHVLYLTF